MSTLGEGRQHSEPLAVTESTMSSSSQRRHQQNNDPEHSRTSPAGWLKEKGGAVAQLLRGNDGSKPELKTFQLELLKEALH